MGHHPGFLIRRQRYWEEVLGRGIGRNVIGLWTLLQGLHGHRWMHCCLTDLSVPVPMKY